MAPWSTVLNVVAKLPITLDVIVQLLKLLTSISRSKPETETDPDPGSDALVGLIGRSILLFLNLKAGLGHDLSVWVIHWVGFSQKAF